MSNPQAADHVVRFIRPSGSIFVYCKRPKTGWSRGRPGNEATIIIRLTHANVWESIGKSCTYIQFIKSCIVLLQAMWEFVLGTASHMLCLNVHWKWRFVWWYHYHRTCNTKLPKKYQKKYHSICCRWHCTGCACVTIQMTTKLWYMHVTLCCGDTICLLTCGLDIASFPGLPTIQFLIACSMQKKKNEGGRPGSIYLGRQRVVGFSLVERTHFTHALFVLSQERCIFRIANVQTSRAWVMNRPQPRSFNRGPLPPSVYLHVRCR